MKRDAALLRLQSSLLEKRFGHQTCLDLRYFFGPTTPASFVVQNPVCGVVKEQTHLLLALMQGWVWLHVPLQVLDCLALLHNCRAEIVPAHRTAITITAGILDPIFLLMIGLLSVRD